MSRIATAQGRRAALIVACAAVLLTAPATSASAATAPSDGGVLGGLLGGDGLGVTGDGGLLGGDGLGVTGDGGLLGGLLGDGLLAADVLVNACGVSVLGEADCRAEIDTADRDASGLLDLDVPVSLCSVAVLGTSRCATTVDTRPGRVNRGAH